jgi:hypothetical protein
MIVTVCELPEHRKGFEDGWTQLADTSETIMNTMSMPSISSGTKT